MGQELKKNGLGVQQSYEKAVKWYTKAAKQGHVKAQYNLGNCYLNRRGIEQDYKYAEEDALEWYTEAAKQGYAPAQCMLGK